MLLKMLTNSALVLTVVFAEAAPVQAKQICGWYVIAACSHSKAAADDVASNGWGSVIDTNKYSGLRRSYFCVVSGPQSKSSAISDRRNSVADGVSADAYIKRACTDARNVGD
jgi:hypothetical protein